MDTENKLGNVLLIGNSGAGKSTLINAVLGEEHTETGYGTAGTTRELKICTNANTPFRLIDTIGFEPSLIKEFEAVNAVRKWAKSSAKTGGEERQINAIWFCVPGVENKLFPKTIHNLIRATSMLPSVPIIVVITQSISRPAREKCIQMVHEAFDSQKQKRTKRKPVKIIPVLAKAYIINDDYFVPPEGIPELIEATNELLPEGVKATEKDLKAYQLKRRRALAHSIVGAATVGGAVVGAVPIPFPDAVILQSIEVAEVNALASVFGVNKGAEGKQLLNSIVETGTVGAVAKGAISALRAIPGINIAAAILNSIIAGVLVALIGEGSVYVFEQIYLGKKTVEDIDWVKKIIESKLTSDFIQKAKTAIEQIGDNTDKKVIAEIIAGMFNTAPKKE